MSRASARIAGAVTMVAICCAASGCGTVVPELLEPYEDAEQTPLRVQNIVRTLLCEVKGALVRIRDDDVLAASEGENEGRRVTTWFDTWGLQMSLSLTVEEQSTVSPGVVLTHLMRNATRFRGNTTIVASQQRNLGFGGSLASTATRINKVSAFYTVAELRDKPIDCSGTRQNSSLLANSDLKLGQWLGSAIFLDSTGDVDLLRRPKQPYNQNVIHHQVKFQVVSSGNVTPAWRLVDLSANQGGAFFNTKRDRTHDLTLTFGPIAELDVVRRAPGTVVLARQLATPAANVALAAEIGVAVGNNVRTALQP